MNKESQHSMGNNDIITQCGTLPAPTLSPPPHDATITNSDLTNLSTSQYLNIVNEETSLKQNHHSHRGSQISLSSPHNQRTSGVKKKNEGASTLFNSLKNTLSKAETSLTPSSSVPIQSQANFKSSTRNSFTDVESLKREQQQQHMEKRNRKSIFQKLKLIRRKRVDQQNTISTDIDENNDDDDDDNDDYENEANNEVTSDGENDGVNLKNPISESNEEDNDDALDDDDDDCDNDEIDDNFVMAQHMDKRDTINYSKFNEDFEEDEATEENDNLNSLCDLDEEVFNKITTNQIHKSNSTNTTKNASNNSTRNSLTSIKKSPTLQTQRSVIEIASKPITKPSSLQPIKTILSNSNSNLGKV